MQAIGFLASLIEERRTDAPHLVVAPLSTLANWEREFQRWTPHLNVVSPVAALPPFGLEARGNPPVVGLSRCQAWAQGRCQAQTQRG